MSFDVVFSPAAEDDLVRLFDFLLDRAATVEDLDRAQAAIDAIQAAVLTQLSRSPFSFRKPGVSSTGYVALYEIASPSLVVILAVRHQREEDYH